MHILGVGVVVPIEIAVIELVAAATCVVGQVADPEGVESVDGPVRVHVAQPVSGELSEQVACLVGRMRQAGNVERC